MVGLGWATRWRVQVKMEAMGPQRLLVVREARVDRMTSDRGKMHTLLPLGVPVHFDNRFVVTLRLVPVSQAPRGCVPCGPLFSSPLLPLPIPIPAPLPTPA